MNIEKTSNLSFYNEQGILTLNAAIGVFNLIR